MTNAELELRVTRLEAVVRELARKAGVETDSGAHESAAVPRVDAPQPEAASLLSLAGVSVLGFGGAYVLRAFTESGALPRTGGVLAGIAYAAVWIWMADRFGRRGLRRNALFQAGTAAGIAFPLVWETTTQFHFITPDAGAALAALVGLVLLAVAHRNRQESIAWLGSMGAIGAALSIASASNVLPPLIAGSIVGAATLHVAMAARWTFVAWPAAALTNALAVMAIGFPLLHGGYEHPFALIAALVSFAALWLAAIIVRCARSREDPQLFDLCESAILLVVGAGGAAAVAMLSKTAVLPLGALCLAAAIAGHVTAVTRRGEVTALFRVWIGAFSSCMTPLALVLLLPTLSAAAVAWAILGAGAMELARRRGSLPYVIEGVAAIVLAALAGGVAKSVIVSLFATSTADANISAGAMVIAGVAVIVYTRAGDRLIARGALLGIAAAGAFSCIFSLATHVLAVSDPIRLALLKTVVLAAIAASLALVSRFANAPAAIGVARAVLVLTGLKLLVEDVRLGRASALVAAFAAYGSAMLIVARCARHHTSQPHAVQVTGSCDTFTDAAPEKNVS